MVSQLAYVSSAAAATGQVSAISPVDGPVAGGTSVTITGPTSGTHQIVGTSGEAVTIYFGTASATGYVDSTQHDITVTTPAAGSPGQVNVTVEGLSGSVHFTYLGTPTLTAMSPASGAPGTLVTLTGSQFGTTSVVQFGGVTLSGSDLTLLSGTQLTFAVPTAANPAWVYVANGFTQSSDMWFTYAAPVLTGVSPNSGPTSGGTPVTLAGSNFGASSVVHFGSTDVKTFTVGSNGTQITLTAPAWYGATVVPVSVTNPWGTSGPLAYTYGPFAAPVLTGIAPVSGPTFGGTNITLSGYNLSGTSVVHFGSVEVTAFAVGGKGAQVTLTSPAGTGTVPVSVTTPSGTSNSLAFTYISLVSPTSPTASCTPGNQRFVCQVYLDLLARTADAGGLQFWTSLLNAGTLTRAQVAMAIQGSNEYLSNLMSSLYQVYLNRMPTAAEVAYWVAALKGGMSIPGAQVSFLSSPEYFIQAQSSNVGFVNALYLDVLGRTADTAGLNHWTSMLSQGTSRSQVAAAVLGSVEHMYQVVAGWYTSLLDRTATQSEMAGWVMALAQGVPPQVIVASFIGSAEYYLHFAS